MTRALSRISSQALASSTPYGTAPVITRPTTNTTASAMLNFHISFMSTSAGRASFARSFLVVAERPSEDGRRLFRRLRSFGLGRLGFRRLGLGGLRRRERGLPFRIGEARLQSLDEKPPVRTGQPWLGLRVTDRAIGCELHAGDSILRRERWQWIPEMPRQAGDEFLRRRARGRERPVGRAQREVAAPDLVSGTLGTAATRLV